MSTEAERMSFSLQASLRRYLDEYPEAADSPEGIRHWWLEEDLRATPIEKLQEALMVLVLSGELQLIILPDGAELYARSVSASIVCFKHETRDDTN